MNERAEYRERLASYKTLNESLQDMHWVLEELEEQITVLNAEQHSDSAQAPQIQRRIADLGVWKGNLEERLLRTMIAVDELAAQLATERH